MLFGGHRENFVIFPNACDLQIAESMSLAAETAFFDDAQARDIARHDGGLYAMQSERAECKTERAIHRFTRETFSLLVAIDEVAEIRIEKRSAGDTSERHAPDDARGLAFFFATHEAKKRVALARFPERPPSLDLTRGERQGRTTIDGRRRRQKRTQVIGVTTKRAIEERNVGRLRGTQHEALAFKASRQRNFRLGVSRENQRRDGIT